MKSFVILAPILLLFCWCASGVRIIEKPAKQEEDPLKELKERFTAAYFRVACIANEGIDPEVSLVPLKKPVHFIQSLIEAKDLRLEKCLKILNDNGFASFEAFREAENRLRLEKEFFREIEVRFVDQVKKCK